jgi:hypothetical protein
MEDVRSRVYLFKVEEDSRLDMESRAWGHNALLNRQTPTRETATRGIGLGGGKLPYTAVSYAIFSQPATCPFVCYILFLLPPVADRVE